MKWGCSFLQIDQNNGNNWNKIILQNLFSNKTQKLEITLTVLGPFYISCINVLPQIK